MKNNATSCFIAKINKTELPMAMSEEQKKFKSAKRKAYQKQYDKDMKAYGFTKTTIVIPTEMVAAFLKLAKNARNKKKQTLLENKN